MAARSVFGFQFSVFSFRFSVFGSRSISLDPGVSHHFSPLTSHFSLLTFSPKRARVREFSQRVGRKVLCSRDPRI
jgi:hypothetical protein